MEAEVIAQQTELVKHAIREGTMITKALTVHSSANSVLLVAGVERVLLRQR